MKTSLFIKAGLVILLAASFTVVNARQSAGEPPVKILPTTTKGILKLIFAADASQGVEVNFYNEDGYLGSDKIGRNHYSKGFLKKYDVRHLKSQIFWMEISSAQINATYKLNAYQKDGRSMVPILEKVTFIHPMDLAKN